jgi:hypothetical protein
MLLWWIKFAWLAVKIFFPKNENHIQDKRIVFLVFFIYPNYKA